MTFVKLKTISFCMYTISFRGVPSIWDAGGFNHSLNAIYPPVEGGLWLSFGSRLVAVLSGASFQGILFELRASPEATRRRGCSVRLMVSLVGQSAKEDKNELAATTAPERAER